VEHGSRVATLTAVPTDEVGNVLEKIQKDEKYMR
jgi:hypothetical protein